MPHVTLFREKNQKNPTKLGIADKAMNVLG